MLKPFILALALGLLPAGAEVRLHPLFCDHAVLQRNHPVPVWGEAPDGERVSVEIDGRKAETTAQNGRWRVTLPGHPAGGPFTLRVNDRQIKDVLFGDVYVCSGQSNMEWPMSAVLDASTELPKVNDSQLRLFHVQHNPVDAPQEKPLVQLPWAAADSKSASDFSAVGYYFGRELRRTQNVPIGLIESSWGGTVAEAWTSREALQANPALAALLENPKPAGEPNSASRLYNGMIAPLLPYPIKGVIWYQGESNAERAKQYRVLFPAMIANWRQAWGESFPFMFVQLAPYQKPHPQPGQSDWAELREAQRQTAKQVDRVAMVVITDAGDEDIHPRNKRPVGERLALAARSLVYGEKVEWSGPTLLDIDVHNQEVLLNFGHAGKGLESRGGDLTGFTVAGKNGKFHRAKARIAGPDRIALSSAEVSEPQHIRYGWDVYPVVNLYNSDGLPASPFEADL